MSTDFEEADDDMKDFALQYANNIIQQSLNQVCLPAVGYLNVQDCPVLFQNNHVRTLN